MHLKSLEGVLDYMLYSKGRLFVSFSEGGDTVAVLDAETGTAEILLNGFPELSCMMVQGDRLFLGQWDDDELTILSTVDWKVVKKVPLKGTPHDILFIP